MKKRLNLNTIGVKSMAKFFGCFNHTTSGASLSVYGQTQMSGELNVTNSGSDAIFALYSFAVHSCKVRATSSASEGGGIYNTTIVNVYGGSLEAEYTGESIGHGIQLRAGGSMNIYGALNSLKSDNLFQLRTKGHRI